MPILKASTPIFRSPARFSSRQVGISKWKPAQLRRTSRFQMEAGRTVEAELLKLNLELLECIGNWDYETYVKLCSSDLTCFEPEAVGNLVEGLDFHKWYFDNLKDGGHPSPTQIMVSPKVRLLGENAAIVTCIRLGQILGPNGRPVTLRCEETRVWEKQDDQWKNVHFHRSVAYPS